MNPRPVKIPGPDHPISIDANPARVVVTVGGKVVADSSRALSLREASYPPVLYIPMADVEQSLIVRTEHSTHCPYKGDASYYSIPSGGDRAKNAIWVYENPHQAVAKIKDHVAFYPDRVDSIEQLMLA